MPGLFGLISQNSDIPQVDSSAMLSELSYGRATISECYEGEGIEMGCVHLGTGGQKALYQSDRAVVLFYGYLTQPSIPPGAGILKSDAAAQHIHDHYLAQGEGSMMDQLAGAFAFAIWDKLSRVLLIANDHLGLRPIYYATHKGVFRFASEVKGILSDPTFPHRLDLEAIAVFFHFSYVTEDKTFFGDIKLLPPASILRYHEGSWTISSYWDITYPDIYPHKLDRWYDELIHSALKGAVERMASPRISYGLSLSGGMDSRWIAAFLAQVQPQSSSFTLGTPGSDDTPPAQKVAATTGLINHYIDLSPGFVAELADTYSYIADGMYGLFSIEEFPLTVRVGNYVDVSVGGFLGDCLFGHEINPVSANLTRQNSKSYWLWRNSGEWLHHSIATQVFGEIKSRELDMLARKSLEKSLAKTPGTRGYQVLQYFNLRNRQRRFINIAQQAKLPYVDIYHPIADHAVLQAALLLPPNQLMMERAYRRALHTFFPDLASIPWTFTLTPPTISVAGIIIKKGTQLTLGKLLKSTPLGRSDLIRPRRYYSSYRLWSRGALRSFIEGTLLSSEFNATGLFDMRGMQTVVGEHMEGKIEATSFIGKALAIAFWSRLFYSPSTPVRPNNLAPIQG